MSCRLYLHVQYLYLSVISTAVLRWAVLRSDECVIRSTVLLSIIHTYNSTVPCTAPHRSEPNPAHQLPDSAPSTNTNTKHYEIPAPPKPVLTKRRIDCARACAVAATFLPACCNSPFTITTDQPTHATLTALRHFLPSRPRPIQLS